MIYNYQPTYKLRRFLFMLCVILNGRFNQTIVISFLALLELIAKYGFANKAEGPSDIGSGNGQQQTNGNRPEEKPSDTSKPYMADQQDAMKR